MEAIQINNLSKKYGNTLALDQVYLEIEYGKIIGLLGRNGAGKTTLINIMSNRVFADKGEVLIDGLSATENMDVQEKVYSMFETRFWTSIKVKDIFKQTNLLYDCFDLDKALSLADKFNLNIDKRFQDCSTGYKSIVKICIALSIDIPYIFLDEPVLGLDANHRELFYKLLLEEYEENARTYVISSHLIEELANVVEEVILIDEGKVILHESVESLMLHGYSVAGNIADVDNYCIDKNMIGSDEVGPLKVSYILGERQALPKGSTLQFSSMNLQKLFVKMTEKGAHIHE